MLFVCLGKIIAQLFACWKQIKSWIDAEKYHLDSATFCSKSCNSRIMCAHTDMADCSFLFQGRHVSVELSVHDFMELFLLIYEMDHSQVYVICFKA